MTANTHNAHYLLAHNNIMGNKVLRLQTLYHLNYSSAAREINLAQSSLFSHDMYLDSYFNASLKSTCKLEKKTPIAIQLFL